MRLFVGVRAPVAGIVNPHVTLCFLGEVDDAAVPTLVATLGEVLRTVPATEAAVEPGPLRRLGPTALVRPVAGLDDAAAAVRRAVLAAGLDVEERPFRAHLTYARRRRGDRAPGAGGPPAVAGARWRVEEVALVRSELGRGPGGTARHTDVAVFALGGASAGGAV